MTQQKKVDNARLIDIATKNHVDPRTLAKAAVLGPEAFRPLIRARLILALFELGVLPTAKP